MRKFFVSRVFLANVLGALVLIMAACVFASFTPSVSSIVSALFSHYSFSNPKTLRAQDLALPQLEIGDLIFRRGDSIESAIISQVSHHHYTHLGLVISTDPLIIPAPKTKLS